MYNYISGPGELPHVNNLSENVFYRLDVILILFSFHFTAHSLLIAKVEKLDNKSFYKILSQILLRLHKPLHATLRLSLVLYTYTRLPLPDLRSEVHCLNVPRPHCCFTPLYSLCLFLLLILL